MSIYYPADCDSALPDHFCDPCEELEQGRVSSTAFIRSTVAFNDPSDPTEWQTHFDNGDIILIPKTKGTFDGGSEVEAPGYGRQSTRLTGYNFQAQFQDPNYANNCAFYNSIKNSRDWKFAYATSSKIHIVDEIVQVIPKNPVQDDINSEVVWDVLVKWAGKDLPCPYDIPPGIFDRCVVNT